MKITIAILLFLLVALKSRAEEPRLVKENKDLGPLCEVAPIVWKGRLCLMECVRPVEGGTPKEYYLRLKDVETGAELGRWAEGYGFGCVIVKDDRLYSYVSRYENKDWNDVTLFQSSDLKNWAKSVVIEQQKEHLFNSSVCEADKGYVMAYETNDPTYTPFSVKFARSADLIHWTKLPGVVFGKDRYTACPCIRYAGGKFYMMYLEHRTPRWFFETFIARSTDLKEWELSKRNPVLTPEGDEGINASDPDIAEFGGTTYLYYSVGDQRTWMKAKRATYRASMAEFFESYFR